MAETAKIINPEAEVILPDAGSSCSLVEQTDIDALSYWIKLHKPYPRKKWKHISYINSSADHKTISDWIVTSRNVEDIVQYNIDQGFGVLFSPDRNMGAYLAHIHPEWREHFKYWQAVCEVHDKFKESEIDEAFSYWTDGRKWLIAHPESPLSVLKRADMIGSTSKMLKWVEDYEGSIGTIFVATEDGLLYNMRKSRPDLDIRQLGSYSGCQCNSCPYMKLNTVESIWAARRGEGTRIDYLSKEVIEQARKPIDKMLNFKQN